MNNLIGNLVLNTFKRLHTNHNRVLSSISTLSKEVIPSDNKNQEGRITKSTLKLSNASVLEPCSDEEVAHVAPYLKPAFNFAAYVNKSETLQELIKLGVDLHRLEKKPDVPQFILGLKFETDIKEHVIFLHDLGLTVENIASLITKNPYIFKESLDNLQVRINYLLSKNFTKDMIARIVGSNAFWLNYSTRDIDKKLGWFQKTFELTGNEVRELTAKQSKLITYSMDHIQKSLFTLKEEMGFSPDEYKKILLAKPRVFMTDHKKVSNTFNYLHHTMKISQETIVQMPEVLTCRLFRLQQRFEYLKRLNIVQFNPKQPGYTSPLSIVVGSDAEFASEVAKTSIQSFNTFLKTL